MAVLSARSTRRKRRKYQTENGIRAASVLCETTNESKHAQEIHGIDLRVKEAWLLAVATLVEKSSTR